MDQILNDNKLSIAVVIRNFTVTGGAEKFSVELAKRMVSRNHRVHIFAHEIDAHAAQGMITHLIPSRMGFSSALSLYHFTRECFQQIDINKFNIVHAHEKGIKCDVTTVHTLPYIHGIERFSLPKKLRTYYLSPRGRLYYWLEREQLKSKAIVAVSETVRRDISRYFPDIQQISNIAPGVDISQFKPNMKHPAHIHHGRSQSSSMEDTALKVLFVGSEFRRKGLDSLILSLPKNSRLVVLGKGEHYAHYHRLIKKADHENHVRFKGLVDNVHDYYASADVMVLPSLREAFGMAALEAMAAGVPVVVSSVTGIADLIVHAQNGFVFETLHELKVILQQLGDPLLRQRIAANARKTAMQQTWDTVAEKYESIYLRVHNNKLQQR